MVTKDWPENEIKLNPDFVYDESMDATILDMYKSGASHTRVAVELGMTRTQFNSLRSTNAHFDMLCEFGSDVAQSTLESIALLGAQGGIKNFNNTILQFLLKSQYAETYSDKKGDKEDGDSLLEQLTAGSLKLVREQPE